MQEARWKPDSQLSDASTKVLLPTDHPFLHSSLRRSPRKHASVASQVYNDQVETDFMWSATSEQRRQSPTKRSPLQRSTTEQYQEVAEETHTMPDIFNDRPRLKKAQTGDQAMATAGSRRGTAGTRYASDLQLTNVDSLLLPLSRKSHRTDELTGSDSEPSFILGSVRPKTRKRSSSGRSVMSLMTEAARNASLTASPTKAGRLYKRRGASVDVQKFVLGEAACLEDLADSDAHHEGEDEDTDLSGFVVDDDAELSYHESMESDGEDEDEDSDYQRRNRKVKIRQQTEKAKPRKRLQRGRRVLDSDDDDDEDGNDLNRNDLVEFFDKMQISTKNEKAGKPEVIDLTTPPLALPARRGSEYTKPSVAMNLLDKLNALKLSPPTFEQNTEKPPKEAESVPALTPTLASDGQTDEDGTHRPITPTATPPRSPTKLKSPNKMLSPSKRGDFVQRSPHRQSMDAFWDLNVVNEWNDKFSPRKEPLQSPRKGLKYFDIWSESDENESLQQIEESSDGLPSPCESPTKMRVRKSPVKSPEKLAKQRAQEEKKAKLAAKKKFDASKDSMAWELFNSLDKYVTNGQISEMAESTGGVTIVWSNTLRSTAGRANWRKVKSSSSPHKNGAKKVAQVRHFASIELAIKVIDRPERLYDTLAHEFCHLANFMVSGILKEPHGVSFKEWAKQATSFLHTSSGRSEWRTIQITTKHGYVIEHKYLWTCTGRANIKDAIIGDNSTDQTGCGAEYGRHSKSIDTEKHRCGVCHGLLVQVRPKPRASPMKTNRIMSPSKSLEASVREINIIQLSD